jgi:hypothetical protein
VLLVCCWCYNMCNSDTQKEIQVSPFSSCHTCEKVWTGEDRRPKIWGVKREGVDERPTRKKQRKQTTPPSLTTKASSYHVLLARRRMEYLYYWPFQDHLASHQTEYPLRQRGTGYNEHSSSTIIAVAVWYGTIPKKDEQQYSRVVTKTKNCSTGRRWFFMIPKVF